MNIISNALQYFNSIKVQLNLYLGIKGRLDPRQISIP